MFKSTGRHKVRNFDINDPDERAECEKVLSKYMNRMGRVLKCEGSFSKEGRYYLVVHWIEDVPQSEFRD